MYLLARVLHDWDDDHAVRILTALGAADGARLRIFERLLPDDDRPDRAKGSDVAMLLLFGGGRERTAGGIPGAAGPGRLADGPDRDQPGRDERHRSQPPGNQPGSALTRRLPPPLRYQVRGRPSTYAPSSPQRDDGFSQPSLAGP
jgi:hypothetical protein